MSRYTAENVRKQLSLLGFHNVEGAVLDSFVQKLKNAEIEQAKQALEEETRIKMDKLLEKEYAKKEVRYEQEEKESVKNTPNKRPSTAQPTPSRSLLASPPLRVPLADAVDSEQTLYKDMSKFSISNEEDPTLKIRKQANIRSYFKDELAELDNYVDENEERNFDNESVYSQYSYINRSSSFIVSPPFSKGSRFNSLPSNKRHDPVSSFQSYAQSWKRDPVLKSKSSASSLEVQIVKERMKYVSDDSGILQRKSRPVYQSYQPPTENKRHELRWKIREQMAKQS